MQNQRIAYLLYRTARLMEIKGENSYKVRAYQSAARTILHLDKDIVSLYQNNEVDKIPGVGKHIAEVIGEVLATGSSAYLNELELEVPPELAELASVPGIGVETVKKLFQHTDIRSPLELEQAIRDKSLLGVAGLGNQAIQRIRRALDKWESQGEYIDLGMAIPLGDGLLELVKKMPHVTEACVVGDLRRGMELVNQVAVLAASENAHDVLKFFTTLPFVREILAVGPNFCRVKAQLGILVTLTVVPAVDYPIQQILLTGSTDHLTGLVERAICNGSIDLPKNWEEWVKARAVQSEADVYHMHKLPFMPPELRENNDVTANIPIKHVTLRDITGDLHVHTQWSDGHNTIAEMAMAARDRGYEYIAICDHSKSLSVAGGLNEERLRKQQAEIRRLNAEGMGIKILSGIELDILPDRRLDFNDDVLAELDVVVGSIHSGFKQDAQTITERIEGAMKNEHVDIIAHPTGRMLRRRPGYQLDIERICATAARTNTILEINASPDRLDLRDIHVKLAQEYGCKFAINTDAHDAKHLSDMRYGVINARRGWLGKDHIINTSSYETLSKSLGIGKSRTLLLT